MRVLLAQSDAEAARSLVAVLREDGHETVEATDVESLTHALRRDDVPRLVLLDWRLPGCDWCEVCQRLSHRRQEHGEGWHLVITSAEPVAQLAAAVVAAGADDYLALDAESTVIRLRLRLGERLLGLGESLREAWETLSRRSTHDDLTNVWNRAAIMQILAGEVSRAQREAVDFGLLMVDLDYFKQVNDTYGHQAGDAVLREVASRLAGNVRRYDQVGRYGGEEFLVVLPGCSLEQVAPLAERLRRAVLRTPVVTAEAKVAVTISLGGTAAVGGEPATMESMIRAADLSLYEAKHAGRNCVAVRPLGDAPSPPAEQVA